MSNKTAIRIAIVIVAATLITLGILSVRKDREQAPAPRDTTFTMSEVEGGREGTNCLVAISGDVYDLSSYAASDAKIQPLCGTDATEAVARLGTSTEAAFAPLKVGTVIEEPAQ